MKKYRKCSVPGCNKIVLAGKDVCKKHNTKESKQQEVSVNINSEREIETNYRIIDKEGSKSWKD